MSENSIEVNRAPVLTLWAAIVSERLGYEHETALTLGKAVAGLNAQAKGRSLGIFGPPKAPEQGGPPTKVGLGEDFWIEVLGRPVPVKNTAEGIRAVVKDTPINPGSVEKYLRSKLGGAFEPVAEAMCELASAYPPGELAQAAYHLYERFRPQIASGKRGWGQKGVLDLDLIRALAERR
jgi:hypothetical protein